MREKMIRAVKNNLRWFENSGVMLPSDGSWGVGERLATASGAALDKIKREFPAWTERPEGAVIEQRRADCNFEAALLYAYAGKVLEIPAYDATAHNLLAFLYDRSGLLNRFNPEYPAGGWNWSHIRWTPAVYFDDNAWCIFIPLALAGLNPGLDRHFRMTEWALTLADAMLPAFRRTFGAETPGEPGVWRDPAGKWSGRLELPHWGSLAVMAFARAAKVRENVAAFTEIRRYHDDLNAKLAGFTASEYAYAILGAAAAYRTWNDPADLELAKYAGRLLLAKLDPATGNLPAEHYEAPTGPNLVDTIYTVNWSFLALQMLAALTGDAACCEARRKQAELLLAIQDDSPQLFFHGCWRGMYDLERGSWGGGDCYEGGAGSIYSGWTNAPIALGLLLESEGKSLLDF